MAFIKSSASTASELIEVVIDDQKSNLESLEVPESGDRYRFERWFSTSPVAKTVEEEEYALPNFGREASWEKKIVTWIGEKELRKFDLSKRKIIQQLERDIAKIDKLVAKQLDAILHHEKFQRLEASWRGIEHLVECKDITDSRDSILLQVLNVTWPELRNDQEGAIEFDQSQFFKKIYEQGIGTPGAIPYSAILVDFEIHPRPKRNHPYDDISILRQLSTTAAAAFAPLFINADPSMFSVDSFSDLRQSGDTLEKLHSQLDFFQWQRFRESEESRFVSVLCPRMLIRRPYRPELDFDLGFAYEERTESQRDYLWCGATVAMGEVLIRNFAESNWFANIRGIERDVISGGMVVGATQDNFLNAPDRVSPKALTDIVISDGFERQLARLGFTALCACKDTSLAAFYSCPSVQKPRKYSSVEASANAELSAMTNYILCASRFGHYVKWLSRDRIGSAIDANEIQDWLTDWLVDYVNRDSDASRSARAEKPLLDAAVQVRAKPGKPGEFDCTILLEPFHSFDNIRASLKLETNLTKNTSTSSKRP